MDEKEADSDIFEATEERSEEEVAWDKEFKDDKGMRFPEAIADMLKLVVKVPTAILQMPLSVIPDETARHTRAAIRETFLAFRSLLGAIGDGIESILADPDPTEGPDGTWGAGPKARPQPAEAATAPTSSGRTKHITLSDDQDDAQPSEGPAPDNSSAEEEDEEASESRGLRADIDY